MLSEVLGLVLKICFSLFIDVRSFPFRTVILNPGGQAEDKENGQNWGEEGGKIENIILKRHI